MSTSSKINLPQEHRRPAALSGPVVVFQWSVEKGWPVEYVSGNVEDVLGYAPEQFLSGELLYNDIIHPDDRARVERECNRYLHSGASHGIHFHYRVERADGELIYVDEATSIVRDERGEATCFVGHVIDVSARRHTEEILRHERSWLESLIQAMPDGILFRDGEGRWLLANDYTLEFLGLEEVDYQGKTAERLAELTDNCRVAKWDCPRTDDWAWDSGEPSSFEQQVPDRDGRPHTFDMIKVPIYESDGSRKGLLVVARDVTERKRLQQLKEEFVSIVSHELRTPLTPITGVLTLLAGGAGGELPARLEKMVELALRNSHRLLYLIDDLLDIQKMSSGQMDFQIRELELAAVVRESLRINIGLEHQNGVKFIFDDTTSDITVDGDKGRLIQVMTNLLSNAAKFSPPNSVVHIRLERVDEQTARVSISDKGPGIAEDFRRRVFDKFAQEDSSSTRKHGGTGLGLTIAKSIVERLGGEIGFETEVDEGTTFYFDLPTD
ncbi:MAG: ATP-binding protein [Persicimonas sp.]